MLDICPSKKIQFLRRVGEQVYFLRMRFGFTRPHPPAKLGGSSIRVVGTKAGDQVDGSNAARWVNLVRTIHGVDDWQFDGVIKLANFRISAPKN